MSTLSKDAAKGPEEFAVPKTFGEVFRHETELLGTPPPRPFSTGSASQKPTYAPKTTGLALSGGGIRSAAFALGVVQALEAADLFKGIRYLSTVSGGGYTGAALIAALYRSNGIFPFSTQEAGDMEAADIADNDAVRAIRDRSRYLMPNGRFDLIVSFAIILRGLVVNIVYTTSIVFILAAFALAANPSEESLGSSFFLTGAGYISKTLSEFLLQWFGTQLVLTKSLLCLLGVWLVVFAIYRSIVGTLARAPERLQSDPESWPAKATAYAILVIGAVFVLEAQRPLFARMVELFGDQTAIQSTTERARYLFLAMAAGTGAIGLSFRFFLHLLQDAQRNKSWSALINAALARVVLYVAAGLLPSLIAGTFFWLVLTGMSKDGQYVRAPEFFTTTDRTIEIWMALTPAFLIAGFVTLRAINGPLTNTLFARTWWEGALTNKRFYAALIAISAIAALAIFIFRPYLVPPLANARVCSDAAWTYADFAGWLGFVALFFSENGNSLHRLYRDRLQYAFAVNKDNDASPGEPPAGPLRLSDLVSVRPYPIINGAVNLQASSKNRRGRNADYFVFTPHVVGSDATLFASTTEYEKAEPHLDVATAMAISGAAVSSAMGRAGVAILAPTLSLLNLRLGFWLRNPRYARTSDERARASRNDWTLRYMLAETFNRLTDTMMKVYVTDGGHIDNLGLRQLLKRRCEVIVVADAEADPAMTFGALVDVERFARIDLGIRIDLPIEPLRQAALTRRAAIERDPVAGATSPPHAHAAIGTIAYPPTSGEHGLPAKDGIILYVKSSLTGDERNYVLDYERRHPKFPHEPTSDQFFGEEQFEAYRALGFHAMTGALQFDDGSKVATELREKLLQKLRPAPTGQKEVPGT